MNQKSITCLTSDRVYEQCEEKQENFMWIGRNKIYFKNIGPPQKLIEQYILQHDDEKEKISCMTRDVNSSTISSLEQFVIYDMLEQTTENSPNSIVSIKDLVSNTPFILSEKGLVVIGNNMYNLFESKEGCVFLEGTYYDPLFNVKLRSLEKSHSKSIYKHVSQKIKGEKLSSNTIEKFRKSHSIENGKYEIVLKDKELLIKRKLQPFIFHVSGTYYYSPEVAITYSGSTSGETLQLEKYVRVSPDSYRHPFVFRRQRGRICTNHVTPSNTIGVEDSLTYNLNLSSERIAAAKYIKEYMSIGNRVLKQGFLRKKRITYADGSGLNSFQVIGTNRIQVQKYALKHNIGVGNIHHG